MYLVIRRAVFLPLVVDNHAKPLPLTISVKKKIYIYLKFIKKQYIFIENQSSALAYDRFPQRAIKYDYVYYAVRRAYAYVFVGHASEDDGIAGDRRPPVEKTIVFPTCLLRNTRFIIVCFLSTGARVHVYRAVHAACS